MLVLPNMLRHPNTKDPKRCANSETYPGRLRAWGLYGLVFFSRCLGCLPLWWSLGFGVSFTGVWVVWLLAFPVSRRLGFLGLLWVSRVSMDLLRRL